MGRADGYIVVDDTHGNGSNYATLFSYHGSDKSIVIPEYVDAIAEGAFRGNTHIRTVNLSNVTDIGEEAFEGCSALETIIMSKDLQEVGTRAFAGCRALRSIACARNEVGDDEWPEVLWLGDEAFADCTALESICLFDINGWLEVGDRCFSGCTALTSVVLGMALASLGRDAFEGCTALERISLPEALRSHTTDEAVHYERVLQDIRDGCPNLQVLERRQLVTAWVEDEDGLWQTEDDPLPWSTEAFRRNVRRLAYREHANQWAGRGTAGLFQGFTSLEELDLTGLDTSRATDLRQMFLGCRNLRSLDLSCLDTSCVETMAHLCHNCHALERVSLAGLDLSQVQSLWSAFDSCEGLIEIDFSELRTPMLEKVGYMFRGCRSLRSVDLRGLDLTNVKGFSHLLRMRACGTIR